MQATILMIWQHLTNELRCSTKRAFPAYNYLLTNIVLDFKFLQNITTNRDLSAARDCLVPLNLKNVKNFSSKDRDLFFKVPREFRNRDKKWIFILTL